MEAENRSEIERVVQLYIDGAREGDASKLREAFHEDARMFGSLGGARYDEPIEELISDRGEPRAGRRGRVARRDVSRTRPSRRSPRESGPRHRGSITIGAGPSLRLMGRKLS